MPTDHGGPGEGMPEGGTGTVDRQASTDGALVVFGLVFLTVALILPFVKGNPWVSGALFVVGISCLIAGTLRFVRVEPPMVQGLVVIGVTLVSLAFGVGLTLTWTQTKNASTQSQCSILVPPTPAAIINRTLQTVDGVYKPPPRLPSLEVAANWPQNIDINASDFVGVTLGHGISASKKSIAPRAVPTITVGGNSCSPVAGLSGKGHLIALPLVVGTPTNPLSEAFGSNYDAYATASLDAIKFSVSPSNPAWQALDQPADRWGWTITPTQSGRQAVLFSVDVQWRPRRTGKAASPVQDRRIWESDPQYIQVNEPPITTGQIQISTVLSGALATGVAALLTALVAKLLPSRTGG